MVRRLLRAAQHACRVCCATGAQAPRRGGRRAPGRAPGWPPEDSRRTHGGEKNAIYARIYARKPSRNKVYLNASRTSKRRVSGCLGMSWRRRNELLSFICNNSVPSPKFKRCLTTKNRRRRRRRIAKQA